MSSKISDLIDQTLQTLNSKNAIFKEDTQETLSQETSSQPNSIIETTNSEFVQSQSDIAVSRFSGAEWFPLVKDLDIDIIGAGGIGSNVALSLAKLNPHRITIWDNDNVELLNIGSQFYTLQEAGLFKTHALINNVKDYSLNEVFLEGVNRKFVPGDTFYSQVAFIATDSMKSRKDAYQIWKEAPTCKILIDGRLAAERFQVFCLTKDNEYSQKKYEEEWLFPDSEAEVAVCSYKQTAFVATMIGSVMINCMLNALCPNRVEPFMIEYSAATMNFKYIS